MKTYGYFCEDKAIEAFIDKTLLLLGSTANCQGFTKNVDCCERLEPPNGRNSSMIKRYFAEYSKIAFSEYSIDLYIAAYDYDDKNIVSYAHHINQQKAKIIDRVNQTVICIPVQCIEYWLWYIKHDNDDIIPLPNSIEHDAVKKRRDIKEDIYGRALSVNSQLAISKPILDQLNIEHLRELSTSFKNFTDQIIEFCNRG